MSAASHAQREKVHAFCCIVCLREPVDPAHLIDRSLTTVGQDDERAAVPLCRSCHFAYDEGDLSILEYLEPRFRVELAFAVERIGLLSTVRRVTNQRYVPELVA